MQLNISPQCEIKEILNVSYVAREWLLLSSCDALMSYFRAVVWFWFDLYDLNTGCFETPLVINSMNISSNVEKRKLQKSIKFSSSFHRTPWSNIEHSCIAPFNLPNRISLIQITRAHFAWLWHLIRQRLNTALSTHTSLTACLLICRELVHNGDRQGTLSCAIIDVFESSLNYARNSFPRSVCVFIDRWITVLESGLCGSG